MPATSHLRSAIVGFHANSTLVAFHCRDQGDDLFFAGYVEQVEDDRFFLRYVNRNGEPGEGGIATAWFDLDEVLWFKAGTPYLIGVERAHRVYGQFAHLKGGRWRTAPKSVRRALRACLGNGEVCRVRFRDGDEDEEYALVKGIDGDSVSLDLLDEGGGLAGEMVLRLEWITGIRVGGIDEATMTYLARLPSD